ncbi:MAG: hypothetical protein IPK17_09545 [Chloroflexi bacterium]|uniref:hypothetical protein n=1 Tax=Candidatus Flexifilum breve TaxID=3140694 RepID=UPI0031366A62|nr:hypothetical protein [Chloroflexota bacterium]
MADEAQRFPRLDSESGEALFLEKCPAFRGVCVLATQSIASLRYGLEAQDNITSVDGRNALPMLLNLIGSFCTSADRRSSVCIKCARAQIVPTLLQSAPIPTL